jgi:hypothetical protein
VKILTLCLVLAATALIATSQEPGAQELRLRIEFDKSTYRADEPIVCRVTLENISENRHVVNNRMLVYVPTGPHELTFQILAPDKATMEFESKVRASFESDDFLLLLPKHLTGRLYDLRHDYTLTKRGEYTVRAYYETKTEAPASLNLPPAWRGSLESNRATFTLE